MRYWSVYCMERDWPGLWRAWEEQQVVTLGWPPSLGYSFEGCGKVNRGWTIVRNRLGQVAAGDRILARLPDHRIGRVGDVLKVAPRNDQWAALVPPSDRHPDGEQGRIITVRWDFSLGPNSREYGCLLPEHLRMKGGRLRSTINELKGEEFANLTEALKTPKHWVPVFAHKFRDEKALSDFIAAHPERLEPGMRILPMGRAREAAMVNAGFADVLLHDKDDRLVVVECKQGAARVQDVEQLRRYLRSLNGDRRAKNVRGVLVVGGAPAVTREVWAAAQENPAIEIFAYRLEVQFQAVR